MKVHDSVTLARSVYLDRDDERQQFVLETVNDSWRTNAPTYRFRPASVAVRWDEEAGVINWISFRGPGLSAKDGSLLTVSRTQDYDDRSGKGFETIMRELGVPDVVREAIFRTFPVADWLVEEHSKLHRSRVLATACDKHLVNLMTQVAPEPADVRVVEIKTAREDMLCQCSVPAQWIVRTV